MKIIKDNYSNRTKQVTCPRCKSILEIEEHDVKYDYDRDAYFVCPLCSNSTYLDQETTKFFKL